MATKQKHSPRPRPLPHPTDARKAAGLTWRGLRERGSFSLATISRCENSGAYPASRATRLLYLNVLGLPTENPDAPVAPLVKPAVGRRPGRGNFKS